MSIILKTGSTFKPSSDEDLQIFDKLPPQTFTILKDPYGNFYLSLIKDFKLEGKLYGDVNKRTSRILNTYRSRTFNTGILLHGEKGSGKTMLAKNIALEAQKIGLPVIMVNQAFYGEPFNNFLQLFDQEAVIIFDEFEKNYDRDSQQQLLTLFDGTSNSKKLFIVTCNDTYRLSEYFINRPGRFYYSFEYKGLDEHFIKEYCDDNLNDKDQIEKVVSISQSYDSFSFDILQSIVEEMNRYNETVVEVLKYINASPHKSSSRYECVEFRPVEKYKEYEVVSVGYDEHFNILNDNFCVQLEKEDDDTENEPKATNTISSNDRLYIEFEPEDMISMKNGVYIFEDDLGNRYKFAKQKPTQIDISKLF